MTEEEYPEKLAPRKSHFVQTSDRIIFVIELPPGKQFGKLLANQTGVYIYGRPLKDKEEPRAYSLTIKNCEALRDRNMVVSELGKNGEVIRKLYPDEVIIMENPHPLYH